MARLQPGRPPGGVGEPAEGVAWLRAAGPGHGGGAAPRRRVRRGPLASPRSSELAERRRRRSPDDPRRRVTVDARDPRRPRTLAPPGQARSRVARVVDVEGSGPRLPGAAMAVNEDGEVAGSVSGGCVEGAVVTEALDIIDVRRAAHRHLRLLRRRGVRRRPHLRRHHPPLHRTARLVSVHDLRRRSGRAIARRASRSRWPPSSRAPDVGGQAARPARSRIRSGSLGDPDLDRVVARDALGELAAGHHAACATTAPQGQASERDVAVFIESFAAAAAAADLRRRRLHRRPGPGRPRCSATGSRCATPARCSPPRPASRSPTRSWSTGPTGCSSGSARTSAPATPSACSPTTPSSTCPRCSRRCDRRRLPRRDGITPHDRRPQPRCASRGHRRS